MNDNSLIKIVAIDDNKDFGFLLKTILKNNHYDVHIFHSAKEAIEFCKEFLPDVVFLDMRLPGMTGCEIAQKINLLCIPAPRIFALTGFDPIDISNELEDCRIEACIQKPMGLEDLTKVLNDAIEGRLDSK